MVDAGMCHECGLDFPVRIARTRRFVSYLKRLKSQGLLSITAETKLRGLLHTIKQEWAWLATYELHHVEEH